MVQTPEQDIVIFKDFEMVSIFYAGLTGFKCSEFIKYLPYIESYNNDRSRIIKLYENVG